MTDEERKGAARDVWSTGRYPSLAPNLLPAIARLVHAAGVDPGDSVLDVGCGTGNVAITAHRSGASVVGVDLARPMVDLARSSAAVANANDIRWVEGDAEALPFSDGEFDVILSNFGHVFAPNPARAGRELTRVAASGGRIAFTAWSPDGVVGELTAVLERHVGDRVGDPRSHLRWGDPSVVREYLPDVAEIDCQRRISRFRYVSPEHFWREFAEESGPLAPVVGAMADGSERTALRRAAVSALAEWFGDNAVRVQYLQVRAVVA